MHQNKEQNKNNGKILAFAPSYNSNTSESRNLGALECNDEEVNTISGFWKGEKFIGKRARKSSFNQSNDYQILHIAAHATIDEDNSDFNRIQFEDDYLSFHELYNYESNAELAVLSACNTGMGQMKTGEGVISLGKGFLAMGVKSLVTTLWSINDCTTSDLMALFYQNLKDGKTKSSSLSEAKKSYLSQASNLESHPYYWAGFKLIGNAKPLQSKSNSLWLYACLALAALGIGFFLFRKNSHSV